MLGLVFATLVATTSGTPSVKVGGVIFFQYAYDVETSANAYDVTRAYINVEPTWSDELSARITPDIVRETAPAITGTNGSITPPNTAGNLTFRLKYAYITWRPLERMSLRAGMQPTPMAGYEEEIWAHRALAQTLVEGFFQLPSSDFGWTTTSRWLGGRLEWNAGIFNGEGFQKPEVNKYKEYQARATWKSGNVIATGFGEFSAKDAQEDKARLVALVAWKSESATLAGEVVWAQDGGAVTGPRRQGNGASMFAYGSLPLPRYRLLGVARVDRIDPNDEASKDEVVRVIGGVGVAFHERVKLFLDYQTLVRDGRDPKTVFFHWDARF